MCYVPKKAARAGSLRGHSGPRNGFLNLSTCGGVVCKCIMSLLRSYLRVRCITGKINNFIIIFNVK